MILTDQQRDELRDLQDRWLNLAVVKHQIRNHGEDEHIAGPDSPTFYDVRRLLLPEWRQWFSDFFV